MDESWKVLFANALAQLRRGTVATENWIFGGGTVLTLCQEFVQVMERKLAENAQAAEGPQKEKSEGA
jgi:hypothetical protein